MSEETHCDVWKIAFLVDARRFHVAKWFVEEGSMMRKTVYSSLHTHASPAPTHPRSTWLAFN